MNALQLTAWIKNNKVIMTVVGGLLLFTLLISVGLALRKEDGAIHAVPEPVGEPVMVNIVIEAENSGEKTEQRSTKIISFFLKPSPAEMREQINALAAADLPVTPEKYDGLRVLWPVYVFSARKQENGSVTTILDGSEDGFGLSVVSLIDSTRYPEILKVQRGRKVWIAGEITGVDPSGTGTVTMRMESVSFHDEMPASVELPAVKPAREHSSKGAETGHAKGH